MSHLISSITELQEFVRVGNGLAYSSILPSINEVESGELQYYLGTGLLNRLIQVRASQVFEPSEEQLSKYAAMALACLAVYKAGPEIEVNFSENGILRQESANEKSAFGGQVKRFRDAVGTRGYKALDSLVVFLEKNEDDFPLWLDSDYYQDRSSLLIRSVREFQEAGENIKGSAITFQALKPIMKQIQETRIQMALPDGMYQSILADVSAAANAYLLKNYIRPAIAKFTIQEALTTLPVEIDHEGVYINQIDQGDGRTITQAPIHLLEKKSWNLRGLGDYYISRMKEYLNQHASSAIYPLWFGSDHYSETLRAQILRDTLISDDRKIYRV